jgi:hypothetical protein
MRQGRREGSGDPWALDCDQASQIREDPVTALVANCLDGGFETLTIIHGASPDREMFASD